MNQRRTIIGACDYSIATMQNLKKDLQNPDATNPDATQVNWAIGGIVATLVSNLIQICGNVFHEAATSGEPNAKQDLTEIKNQLGEFIDKMVSHE